MAIKKGDCESMMLDKAREYAAQGIKVFPCHTPIFQNGSVKCSCNHDDCGNIGKHPRTKNGFKDASDDIEKIEKWWTMWPDANIGAICEKIFILDCDSAEAFDFIKDKGIPDTFAVSRGNHKHFYFKMTKPVERQTNIEETKLDFLGLGGYVILSPSVHVSGDTYVNDRPFNYESLANIPEWVYGFAKVKTIQALKQNENIPTVSGDISMITDNESKWLKELKTDIDRFGDILDDPEYRAEFFRHLQDLYNKKYFDNYENWIKCGAALYHSGKFSVEDFYLVTHKTEKDKELALRKWNSFGNGEEDRKVKIGTIISWIREQSDKTFFTTEWFMERRIVRSEKGFKDHIQKAEAEKKYPWIDERMPPILWIPEHCKISRKVSSDGKKRESIRPLPTIENFKRMLSYYGIVLHEDLMRHMIRDCVKGRAEDNEGKSSNAFAEILRSACALNEFPATQSTINSLYIGVGHEMKMHPVKDWLDTDDGTGATWDGVSRFEEACGLIKETTWCNKNLKSHLLRAWFISCIAALYEEHFRTRGVLVIQGPQSCGKTSVLKNLFPKFSFLEGASFIAGNKDSLEQLISHWCCELSEIEVLFKKSDISQIKAFLTNEKDVIRFPYEHRSEEIPRRTIFCGSVNEETFLQDKTGNSRFWVIPATSCVFNHSINIRQFWLEIREMYRAGGKWWLDADVEKELEESNIRHSGEDPLSSILFSYYDPNNKATRVLTCTEILLEMGYKEGNVKRSDANDLARIMKKSGTFKQGVKSATKSPGWKMPPVKEKTERDIQSATDLRRDEENEQGDTIPF
jgi:hypothetical protein